MSDHTLDASSVKVCSRCGETELLSEYTLRKSGKQAGTYEARCRVCMRLATAEYRARNPERVKASALRTRNAYRDARNAEYRERLANDPEYRKRRNDKSRAWRDKNRDRIAEYNAERFRSMPEKMRAAIRDSANRTPERLAAHKAVYYAVKVGKLPHVRTQLCAMCGQKTADHYHHHNGYVLEHKLDVTPLCTECHGRAHWVD